MEVLWTSYVRSIYVLRPLSSDLCIWQTDTNLIENLIKELCVFFPELAFVG